MAIFVTGDTHGSRQEGRFCVDGYIRRLNTDSFPEQRDLTKNDYVIICGDFCGIWNTDRFSASESSEEQYSLDWLDNRPFTTLFVPGNHENYDRLTGCVNEKLLDSWFYRKMPDSEKDKLRAGYPRKEWHGGFVREIRPSVLMLEHGDIFDINGRTCFAFGGARSHDISAGILDPAEYPDEKAFKAAYKKMVGRPFRVRGVSWWDQEMPSFEAMAHGQDTLREFMKDHERVDFIFTHDAPASDKIYLGYTADALNCYLESLRDMMKYGRWFYGHLHDNRRVMDNHYLLYEQLILIQG